MPRAASLLLDGRTADQLRRSCRTTHRRLLHRLFEQAAACTRGAPPPEHPVNSITYIGAAVANAALAYLITGQEPFLEAARRWIAGALAYPNWGEHRMPNHDLDAAWLLAGLGLAYNWIGPRLPPGEQEELRAKLALQGERLFRFARDTEGKWWSSSWWQNHNWICHAGLLTAGYALQAELPAAAGWIDRAKRNFRTVVAYLPEDGSWHEGVVYWRYGMPWLLLALALLAEQDGVDLHDHPFFRETFYFRLYHSAPGFRQTVNFGDCHDRRSGHSCAVYWRLAARLGIGHAQWLANWLYDRGEVWREQHESMVKPGILPEAFLELLWYDPAVTPVPVEDLPRVRYWPDLGAFNWRSGWDEDGVCFSFKCGPGGGHKAWELSREHRRRDGWETLDAGHDHPDQGSFIYIAHGSYLAVDEGYSNAKQTAHHNTVLVDGRGHAGEGAYHIWRHLADGQFPRLGAFFAAGPLVYARGEAAAVYPPELSLRRFDRHVLLGRRGHTVVYDQLESDSPRSFEWLLQSDWPARTVSPGHFVVASGPGELHIHALLPVAASVRTARVQATPSRSSPHEIIDRTQSTLVLSAPGPAPAARFLTLLLPAPAGVPPAAQVAPLAVASGAGLTVSGPGWHEWYAFADGHGLTVAGGENHLASDGAWCTVQQQAGAGVLLAAGHCTRLEWDGRSLLTAGAPVTALVDCGAGAVTVEVSRPCAVQAGGGEARMLAPGRHHLRLDPAREVGP